MKKLTILILLSLMCVLPAAARDYGPFTYSTVPVTGIESEDDTLMIPELYLHIGTADVVGKYVWISKTTDNAAPENQACRIVKYTASSNQTILDTEAEAAGNDAVLGLSATLTIGDIVWVVDSPPPNALLRVALTATKVASGVSVMNYNLYDSNVGDTINSVKLEYAEARMTILLDSLNVAMDSIQTLQNEVGVIDDFVDTEVQSILNMVDTLYYEHEQPVTKTAIVMGAGLDSVTVFTVTGNVWLTGLGFEVTTQPSAVSDSLYWVGDAATGAWVGDIDKGEEMNAAAVGTTCLVASSTLQTTTTTTLGGAPVTITPWKLFLTDGTVLRLASEGNDVTGRYQAFCTYISAEEGGKIVAN